MHPSQFCVLRLVLDLCNIRLDLHRFKLDFLEILDFLGFLVHRLRMRLSLHRVLQLSISQELLSTRLQDLIPLPLSELAIDLLQHVLVAVASSSEYGECSCQLFFAKSLHAMRVVVASGSSRQTSFADPILNIPL